MADELDEFLDFMRGPTRLTTAADLQAASDAQLKRHRVVMEALRRSSGSEAFRIADEYRLELAGGPKARLS